MNTNRSRLYEGRNASASADATSAGAVAAAFTWDIPAGTPLTSVNPPYLDYPYPVAFRLLYGEQPGILLQQIVDANSSDDLPATTIRRVRDNNQNLTIVRLLIDDGGTGTGTTAEHYQLIIKP